jgi:hypothetical protein
MMRRIHVLGWAALLACPAIVLAQDENLRPAKSPSEIAQYINRHHDIHWEPLLKGFGIGHEDLPLHCGNLDRDPCSAEIIRVPGLPQVVLRVEGAWWQETYWRFFREGSAWRFGGSFSPFVKYFKPRHRIISFGGTPFLLVNGQGEAGTGLSSEFQDWFDLTLPKFEPVLSFTVSGHLSMLTRAVSQTIETHVRSLEAGPPQRIRIARRAEFMFEGASGDPIRLGSRSADTVYTRQSNGIFELNPAASTCSKKEVEEIYDSFTELSKEEFLHFDFDRLREVAAGPSGPEKNSLKRFLILCGSTPEKRILEGLLAGRPPQ